MKNYLKNIGTYVDPIINKNYNLYIVDAKMLSDKLKSIYSKFHNIPNVEDFKRSSKSSDGSNLMKYENNFISVMSKSGILEDMNEAVLIDGYRRLFMDDVPENIDVFVKVYNSDEITLQDEVKLMMEFNYWKKFNKERSSFFERGFSLWIFLKTGCDINNILESLQTYLHYRRFFEGSETEPFETLFFDNINLFDDIKFISELKHRNVSFNIGKKEYKDLTVPISRQFIENFGKLRSAHKAYIKIDIENFYSDILNIEAFKGIVVDYNEAKIGDKKDRCLAKALDFLESYIKSEYFGAKKEKTVIEIQEAIKAKLDEVKKKYSPLVAISDFAATRQFSPTNTFQNRLIEEIKSTGADTVIWVTNTNMKQLNTNIEVITLKYLGTREATREHRSAGGGEYNVTLFLFEDAETKKKYEWTLGNMAHGTQKFYILKDKSKFEKKKRPDFVIYSVLNYGANKGTYLVKAKTMKRVVEIANSTTLVNLNINHSYLANYCHDLSHQPAVLEATKDMEEGIIKWKED